MARHALRLLRRPHRARCRCGISRARRASRPKRERWWCAGPMSKWHAQAARYLCWRPRIHRAFTYRGTTWRGICFSPRAAARSASGRGRRGIGAWCTSIAGLTGSRGAIRSRWRVPRRWPGAWRSIPRRSTAALAGRPQAATGRLLRRLDHTRSGGSLQGPARQRALVGNVSTLQCRHGSWSHISLRRRNHGMKGGS